MSTENLNSLIDNLSDEGCSTKRMSHPFVRLVPVILAVIAYLILAANIIGVRVDWMDKFADPFFMLEILLMLGIAVSASFSVSWSCVPDMRGCNWICVIPLSLLSIFIAWMTIRSFTEDMDMDHGMWGHCVIDTAIMGTLPAIAMTLFSRTGSTTRPVIMWFMNTLSVTGLCYIALRFTCSADTVAHGTLAHLLPFVVFGMAVGVVARRLFRW